MKSFMIETFTDVILRVVLSFILSETALGSVGIWFAWPVGWCVSTVMSILFYRRGPWFDRLPNLPEICITDNPNI